MNVKEFDKLTRRDFDNGSVLDQIRKALRDREVLMEDCNEVVGSCEKCQFCLSVEEIKTALCKHNIPYSECRNRECCDRGY